MNKKVNIIELNLRVLKGNIFVGRVMLNLFSRRVSLMMSRITSRVMVDYSNKIVYVEHGSIAFSLMSDNDLAKFKEVVSNCREELNSLKNDIIDNYDTYISNLMSMIKDMKGINIDEVKAQIPTKEEIENNFQITLETSDYYVEGNKEVKQAFVLKALSIIKGDVIEKIGRSLEVRRDMSSMLQNEIKYCLDRIKSINVFHVPELNELCENSKKLNIDDLIIRYKELEKKYK